jgi:hypothetical protein
VDHQLFIDVKVGELHFEWSKSCLRHVDHPSHRSGKLLEQALHLAVLHKPSLTGSIKGQSVKGQNISHYLFSLPTGLVTSVTKSLSSSTMFKLRLRVSTEY